MLHLQAWRIVAKLQPERNVYRMGMTSHRSLRRVFSPLDVGYPVSTWVATVRGRVQDPDRSRFLKFCLGSHVARRCSSFSSGLCGGNDLGEEFTIVLLLLRWEPIQQLTEIPVFYLSPWLLGALMELLVS